MTTTSIIRPVGLGMAAVALVGLAVVRAQVIREALRELATLHAAIAERLKGGRPATR